MIPPFILIMKAQILLFFLFNFDEFESRSAVQQDMVGIFNLYIHICALVDSTLNWNIFLDGKMMITYKLEVVERLKSNINNIYVYIVGQGGCASVVR